MDKVSIKVINRSHHPLPAYGTFEAAGMDIRAISEKVMQDLFQALAMRYDFTLPETV